MARQRRRAYAGRQLPAAARVCRRVAKRDRLAVRPEFAGQLAGLQTASGPGRSARATVCTSGPANRAHRKPPASARRGARVGQARRHARAPPLKPTAGFCRACSRYTVKVEWPKADGVSRTTRGTPMKRLLIISQCPARRLDRSPPMRCAPRISSCVRPRRTPTTSCGKSPRGGDERLAIYVRFPPTPSGSLNRAGILRRWRLSRAAGASRAQAASTARPSAMTASKPPAPMCWSASNAPAARRKGPPSADQHSFVVAAVAEPVAHGGNVSAAGH